MDLGMPRTILVVEDDPDVRRLVVSLLTRADLGVVEAANGRSGLRAFYDARPDLVVLDIDLPELDGWQVLERLREVSSVPVIMLTAQGAEVDKVRGLRGGADDYVTKPFGPHELIARIEALLRRARAATDVLASADGEVTLDEVEHRVMVSGEPLELTPTEFRLLAVLLRNPRQVVTQEQLLDELWGRRGDPKQLRLYVSYVRRKFKPFAIDPIETVRGIGYRLRSSR
jgi:DNA-binding response OmpR family regulator